MFWAGAVVCTADVSLGESFSLLNTFSMFCNVSLLLPWLMKEDASLRFFSCVILDCGPMVVEEPVALFEFGGASKMRVSEKKFILGIEEKVKL